MKEKLSAGYLANMNTILEGTGFRVSDTDNGELGKIDGPDILFEDLRTANRFGYTEDELRKDGKFFTPRESELKGPLAKDIAKYKAALEGKRQGFIKKSLSMTKIIELRHDPRELPKPYQKAYPHYVRIGELTEELYKLERDLNTSRYEEEIATQKRNGDMLSSKLWKIQKGLGCHPAAGAGSLCSPLATFPEGDPNSTFLSDEIDEAEWKKITESDLPNRDMLVSPYTYVTKGELAVPGPMPFPVDGYDAAPYNQHPKLRPVYLKIADQFEAISKIPGMDAATVAITSEYARAIREEKGARPFDKAEELWATLEPKELTFRWGPTEPIHEVLDYADKRGVEFALYRIKPFDGEFQKKYENMVEELNDLLAKRIKGYKRPDLKKRVLVFSDLWIDTGWKLLNRHATTFAATLPNDGAFLEDHARRVDVRLNINNIVGQELFPTISERVLLPKHRQYVDPSEVAKFSYRHELGHNTGITELPIYSMKALSLEESRANMANLTATKDKDFRVAATTYVVGLVRQVRFGPEAHGLGAQAEFGTLFKEGIVKLVQRDGNTYLDITDLKRYKEVVTDYFVQATKFEIDLQNAKEKRDSLTKGPAKEAAKAEFNRIEDEMLAWMKEKKTHIPKKWWASLTTDLSDLPIHIATVPVDLSKES